MRGDQLARQWQMIQASASLNGLTIAEIAQREETGIRTIYLDLEPFQASGFPLYTQRVGKATRWPFIASFKFKIQPLSESNQYTWLLFSFPNSSGNIRTFLVSSPIQGLRKSNKLFSDVCYSRVLVRRNFGPGF
jgi:hypothetical protein